MIIRSLQTHIESKFFKQKAIIVTGARQVGKTTMLKQLVQKTELPLVFLNCDEANVRTALTDISIERLKSIIGSNKFIFIDEAQRVANIGLTLKLIVDNFTNVQLLVTGSSSLDLAVGIKESLTGRKFEYHLFPFSVAELVDDTNILTEEQALEKRLIYGSYPDAINYPGEEKELLMNLANSYLFKDILSLTGIRKPLQLEKLVQALALQIGNEVSYTELGQMIEADKLTVERYIDLLEQCFVVFRLGAYSSNLRNEIKKSKKIYFYDTGIRNAVIENFSMLALRQDAGQLFENYIISEYIKASNNKRKHAKYYFWRSFQQQEIDLIEEIDGKINAMEIKWNENKKVRFPSTFLDAYSTNETYVINKSNYTSFLI
ncbi:ATP-binding protein [Pedobacter sp. ISL-68]|uniref:ATP-binding protein n=1 Tax=unclassified Pedobacter TaxID=2628915 RepID=UPI001BE669FE|nr:MULTISPECIES: ATP-binding protein [unclassified Pedobacter]MBT2563444.1 ATP-binding protein [Pedobacter sp. ISL-64]MBT2592936.1 ATP-binding protein [Pedobacter sp. ISL-68]